MTISKDRDFIWGLSFFDNEVRKYLDYSEDFHYQTLFIYNYDKSDENWITEIGLDLKSLTYSSKEKSDVKKVKKHIDSLKTDLLKFLKKLSNKITSQEQEIAFNLANEYFKINLTLESKDKEEL